MLSLPGFVARRSWCGMRSRLQESPGLRPGVVPAPVPGPGRFSTSHGGVRVLQHPLCLVLNSEPLPLFHHLLPHRERCCQIAGGTAAGSQARSPERGDRQTQCWEQSVEQGRAKAARQTQTMCSQQAELLSCPDGQTETIRLRRRDNRASSGEGKGCGVGEALPVLSCSCCETTDGLQWERESTLNAQRGRIQREAAMSAGLTTGLEAGDVGRWVLLRAQPAAGCATAGKSLLPVLWFPSICWDGAVSPTDLYNSQHKANSLNALGSLRACSRAHIKVGNADEQEIPPSGVLLSRDTQGRPHLLLASSPAAPTSKAWSVDFCMGVLPTEPAGAGSFADDSAGDVVPSESLQAG